MNGVRDTFAEVLGAQRSSKLDHIRRGGMNLMLAFQLGLLLCTSRILVDGSNAYTSLGCFWDVSVDEELYESCPMDWNNFATFVSSILAECTKRATNRGLPYIGLKECRCFSVANFNPVTAVKSRGCINGNDFCSLDDKVCSGYKDSTVVFKAAEEKCNKKLDIAVAMDASSSVEPFHWDYSKGLVKSMIDSMLIGAENVKMSIMMFSTLPKEVVRFDEVGGAAELESKINALKLVGGFTRTDLALNFAKTEIFSSAGGERDGSEKVFVLISDGETNGIDATVNWHESVTEPASQLRSQHVKIFTVSLGSNVPRTEIKAIANQPTSDFSLNISDFSYPSVSGRRLARMICGEKFINVALGKVTSQSSTFSSVFGASSHAVDGNISDNLYEMSCARTKVENNPWWRVDLGEEMEIFEVKIYNQGGCCSSVRRMEIRIGSSLEDNGNTNPLCREDLAMFSGEKAAFVCMEPMQGRYVNVRIPTSEVRLSLCEVQVFAKVTKGTN